jgi:hypothetical protein
MPARAAASDAARSLTRGGSQPIRCISKGDISMSKVVVNFELKVDRLQKITTYLWFNDKAEVAAANG